MKPSRMSSVRQAKYAARNSFTISADTSSLDDLLDDLEADMNDAVRPAAQAAAQVIYDEVERNASKIKAKSGNLQNSIYQAFSADNSGPGKATYHISWNAKVAPHGHLIEYGHMQRYATYLGKDGQWHIAIRPNMRGKPPPKGRASRAVKDAYYVTLPTPVQVPAKPFVRPAVSKFDAAMEAAKEVLYTRMDAKL